MASKWMAGSGWQEVDRKQVEEWSTISAFKESGQNCLTLHTLTKYESNVFSTEKADAIVSKIT